MSRIVRTAPQDEYFSTQSYAERATIRSEFGARHGGVPIRSICAADNVDRFVPALVLPVGSQAKPRSYVGPSGRQNLVVAVGELTDAQGRGVDVIAFALPEANSAGGGGLNRAHLMRWLRRIEAVRDVCAPRRARTRLEFSPMRGPAAGLNGAIPHRPGGDVHHDAAMEVSEMQTPNKRPPSFRSRRPEAARLLRFAVVGVAATVTHYAIALSMVAVAGFPAHVAHVAGFLGAAPISFFGHYHWTFASRARYGRAALRFVAVTLGAFLVSLALLEALERLTTGRVAASLFVSVLVIPIASYVLNRVFVFHAPETRRAP